jgi:hypothetical protein
MTSDYHLVVDWGMVNKKLKKYPKDIKRNIKQQKTINRRKK